MDFSILFRVLYNPRRVFEEWGDKPRPEPLIFIAFLAVVLNIIAYIGRFAEILNHPLLFIFLVLFGLLALLILPILQAMLIWVITLAARAKFFSLLSAFILCILPILIESGLVLFSSPIIGPYPLTISYFIDPFKSSSTFWLGMISSISLSFFWTIFLWWRAITYLLKEKLRQNITLVGSLVILNLVINGLMTRFMFKIAQWLGVA